MGQPRPKRIAANEAFLREVNERIVEKTAELAGEGFTRETQECDLLCSCGRPDCSEILSLTIAEFEQAQTEDDQFVVAHGHDVAEIERVVEQHDNYVVVKKKCGFKPEDLT